MKLAIVNIFILICVSAIECANTSSVPGEFEQNTASSSGFSSRGQDITIGEFPWIVALMQTKVQPASYFCGGTLVSTTFVLSGM